MATLKTSLWSHSCLPLLPVPWIIFLDGGWRHACSVVGIATQHVSFLDPQSEGKREVTFLNLLFWYFHTSLILIPVCSYIMSQTLFSSTLFLIAIFPSYFIVFHIRNLIYFEHIIFDACETCHSYVNAVKWSWQKNYVHAWISAWVCCLFALIACSCLVNLPYLVSCLVPVLQFMPLSCLEGRIFLPIHPLDEI